MAAGRFKEWNRWEIDEKRMDIFKNHGRNRSLSRIEVIRDKQEQVGCLGNSG
jgi:hypothetical protein